MGGAFGVAACGAVMNFRLSVDLPQRVPAQALADVGGDIGALLASPAAIRALPPPVAAGVAAMRDAWQSGGVGAATEIAMEFAPKFSQRGSVEESATYLDEQSANGVDLHQVSVDTDDDQQWADVLSQLVK